MITELAPPLLTTPPYQREVSTDLTCITPLHGESLAVLGRASHCSPKAVEIVARVQGRGLRVATRHPRIS
ncbi:hypothetical protein TNCV_5043051 [Trichonephila clavipes]|nr:hypothetical protein TNCV_5043051 [Trichonephila clavipes]